MCRGKSLGDEYLLDLDLAYHKQEDTQKDAGARRLAGGVDAADAAAQERGGLFELLGGGEHRASCATPVLCAICALAPSGAKLIKREVGPPEQLEEFCIDAKHKVIRPARPASPAG
jgi:hypothetical protein